AGEAGDHPAVQPRKHFHGGHEGRLPRPGAILPVAHEDDGLTANVGKHALLVAPARVDHAQPLVPVERRDHALHAPAVVEVEDDEGERAGHLVGSYRSTPRMPKPPPGDSASLLAHASTTWKVVGSGPCCTMM